MHDLYPSIKTVTLFGNLIAAVVKHFFVKQAEFHRDWHLYALLKSCVSQQLSWQCAVNTQERRRSKDLVLTLRLRWTLPQWENILTTEASSFLRQVKQIHLKDACLKADKEQRRRTTCYTVWKTDVAGALRTKPPHNRFMDTWFTLSALILTMVWKINKMRCLILGRKIED